jgi:hypothetical protein
VFIGAPQSESIKAARTVAQVDSDNGWTFPRERPRILITITVISDEILASLNLIHRSRHAGGPTCHSMRKSSVILAPENQPNDDQQVRQHGMHHPPAQVDHWVG